MDMHGVSTDATFIGARTARNYHQCVICKAPIRPGQRYAFTTYAPRAELNPTPGKWSTYKHHKNAACDSDAELCRMPEER